MFDVKKYQREYQHRPEVVARRRARRAKPEVKAHIREYSRALYARRVEHGRARSRQQYAIYMERMAQLKAAPCMDCGNSFPSECMDFDHVRGTKLVQVSDLTWSNETTLMTEIAKCDLVCANCHRIRTKARRTSAAA